MAEPFVGEIRSFGFGIVPAGWMACNGQLLQITENSALYSLLGTRFGGDGVKTFALPNLQGRVPICASTPKPKVAASGGEEGHALTINEMPAHQHEASAGSNATTSDPSGAFWGTSDLVSYNAAKNQTMSPNCLRTSGGGAAHSNMQPYTVLNYCIATQGIYPPQPY